MEFLFFHFQEKLEMTNYFLFSISSYFHFQEFPFFHFQKKLEMGKFLLFLITNFFHFHFFFHFQKKLEMEILLFIFHFHLFPFQGIFIFSLPEKTDKWQNFSYLSYFPFSLNSISRNLYFFISRKN